MHFTAGMVHFRPYIVSPRLIGKHIRRGAYSGRRNFTIPL
jgi:hypothetical protein